MLPRTLRRLGYLVVLAWGVLDAVAPRVALRLKLAPAAIAFENVGAIEPREGYLRAARAMGLGMIVAGATGLALESTGGETGQKTSETSTTENEG
jgi:hypothetical protein